MDVVDTLRHNQDLVARELNGEAREQQLDRAAARDLPPAGHRGQRRHPAGRRRGAGREPVRLHAAQAEPRRHAGRALCRAQALAARRAFAIFLLLALGFGGYFLVWKPYQRRAGRAGAHRARREAAGARWMRSTRPSSRKPRCSRRRAMPKPPATAASVRPPKATEPARSNAIADLTAIRDTLRQEYQLRIVSRDGVKVRLLDLPRDQHGGHQLLCRRRGHRLRRQRARACRSSTRRTTLTETVNIWGIRVPEAVYRAVEADKTRRRHHPAQHCGHQAIRLSSTPTTPCQVLGGAVTRW